MLALSNLDYMLMHEIKTQKQSHKNNQPAELCCFPSHFPTNEGCSGLDGGG
jgi:hypothetical protein